MLPWQSKTSATYEIKILKFNNLFKFDFITKVNINLSTYQYLKPIRSNKIEMNVQI